MPKTVLTTEATLTERYQNTVPAPVRKALHLKKGDKVRYTIEEDGRIYLSRADQPEDDPVLGQFLNFLAEDMSNHPDRLQNVSPTLANRINSLVDDIEIDLDAPLSDEDE